jgi:hypothetical protein
MLKQIQYSKNRHYFLYFIMMFLFSGVALSPCAYAKTVILRGTPVSVKQSNAQGLKEGPLTSEEQAQEKIVIAKEGEKYFWDSNGNGEMIRKDKGNAYYFVDLQGRGFVEVVLDKKSSKYYYMENKSSEGCTYYGVADLFLKE